MNGFTGLELQSTIDAAGGLTLSLETVTLSEPSDDEIIVQVEAAPINPSDIGLLIGPADIHSAKSEGTAERPATRMAIPSDRLESVRTRVGQPMPVGNEGAGTVVAAGTKAQHLLGKRIAIVGAGSYTQYRKLKASDQIVTLPEGISAAEGAGLFVNPLTALAFVETMKLEGHKAIVHTAAASNLGQMLVRTCLADGIPLVNIVRSGQQADILRNVGATHIVDSTDADFQARLEDMINETGATLAFDAIGGGSLGSDILYAMERAATRGSGQFNRYGSDRFKQLYIYGALDQSPIVINRSPIGFVWSVGGFLLGPFAQKVGPAKFGALIQRAVSELTTTFKSHYTATIGLKDVLDPAVIQAYSRRATGEKYLIDPAA